MSFRRYLVPTTLSLAVAALTLVIASDALAVETGLEKAAAGASIPVSGDIKAALGRVLKTLLGFVGTLFLVLMVYAGFLYMTARGDSKRVDSAKQLIIGAVIGIVIIGSAYSITSFVLDQAGGKAASTTTPTAPSEPGTVKIGGTCATSADCADSNICYQDHHICGVPHTTSQGGTCGGDAECKEPYLCVKSVCDEIVAGSGGDGDRCRNDDDCASDANYEKRCVGGVCESVPWGSVPIGGNCKSLLVCGENVDCINGKCTQLKAEGEVCDQNGGDQQCMTPLYCQLAERSYCEGSGSSLCNGDSCGADGPCIPSVWKCTQPSS